MTTADRPPVTDDARAVREAAMNLYRAMRRANPDAWAEVDKVEDWTYWDDIARTAQVTLAAGRAETTIATTEDAEAVVAAEFDNAPDEGWDSLTFAQHIVKALADAGLLARPTPSREDLARTILSAIAQHGEITASQIDGINAAAHAVLDLLERAQVQATLNARADRIERQATR